jgi:hypothetical protein
MNSNLVAFYYGNLTHPSADPPRIGFLSMVPDNASSIVQSVVSQAQANGGMFGSMPIPYVTNSISMTADPLNYLTGTLQAAPTGSVSNVLMTPTSFSIPSESALSSPSNTSDKSSASSLFGHPSNAGHALCTILLTTFLRTMFSFL